MKAQDTTAGIPQNAKVTRDKDRSCTGGRDKAAAKQYDVRITKEKNAFSEGWRKARDSVVTYW